MPTKPNVPVAVVGGEEGGRAPIVVHDNLAQDQNNPPDESGTQVPIGQAEPGHDIFAAGLVPELKSQDISKADEEVSEEKVVSTMEAGTSEVKQEETVPAPANNQTPPKEDSSQNTIDSSTTPTESTMGSTEEKPADPSRDSEEVLKEHGPAVEEDAEADRVRDELFREQERPDGAVPRDMTGPDESS
jgi:dolichyl-phosphate-mannose-protein mannosyltransferase